VNRLGDISSEETQKLVKMLPNQGYLILNFDDEMIRGIKKESSARILTLGLQSGSDFQASDIKLNTGTNFKINHEGDIVPIWLKKLYEKEQIYSVLAGVAVGTIFDLNLIEISQTLSA